MSSVVGLIGIVVIVVIAEFIGGWLRRPLAVLLRSEKGPERSDFWNAYIRVILVLVPAAFALLSFPTAIHEDPLLTLAEQLRWGIAGLLIALAVAGKALRVPQPPRPVTPYVPPIVTPPAAGPAR